MECVSEGILLCLLEQRINGFPGDRKGDEWELLVAQMIGVREAVAADILVGA